MNAPTTTRYIFDEHFDGGKKRAALDALAAAKAQVDAAREHAYQQGLAEGHARAQAEIAAATRSAMEASMGQVAQVLAEVDAMRHAHLLDAALLTRDMAHVLAGWQSEAEPFRMIDELASDVFANLSQEPRLVVRVADAIIDDVRGRLLDMADQLGFPGRLVFLAEPDMAAGDCVIEWSHGGIEARADERRAGVAQRFAAFLSGLREAAGAAGAPASEIDCGADCEAPQPLSAPDIHDPDAQDAPDPQQGTMNHG